MRRSLYCHTDESPRTAATLVEVLMSLLIMSIGIVSVFALFPVAILSSIKATQLTNAKLLKDNVVEILRANPQLAIGAFTWEPNATFGENQFVARRLKPGQLLPASNVLYRTNLGGQTGATEPIWSDLTPLNPLTDGGVTWNAFGTFESYIIDPLGFEKQAGTFRNVFGNDGTTPVGVNRLDLQTTLNQSPNSFRSLFFLNDTWSTTAESGPRVVTPTTIEFPPEIDLATVGTNFRVTVTSLNGKFHCTRHVQSAPVGQTVTLSPPPLPALLDSTEEVSSARLEVLNNRYSWLLAVKRDSAGQTQIQCAIVFNRDFSLASEEAYEYTYSPTEPDTAFVQTGSATPLIAPGNYAFDVTGCRWHKIVAAPNHLPGNVVLDSSLAGTSSSGRLIFLPGIIRVFDIEL